MFCYDERFESIALLEMKRMIDRLKRFFEKRTEAVGQKEGLDPGHDIRVAVCALFVEIGRIDERFTREELDLVLSILKEKYGLSEAHADDLLEEATRELDESIDLWQFARRINTNYSNSEKMEIVEMMWRVVFVDGKMDDHEHYIMNKLKNLLRISHKDLIDAKLKVSRQG
jgi:uncharacterized tellurite resistance protein B-like protein